MPDEPDKINLRQFESALGDPNVTKFAPKVKGEENISSLIKKVRDHIKAIGDLCDEMVRAVDESEQHARKAADSLMDMIKRVK